MIGQLRDTAYFALAKPDIDPEVRVTALEEWRVIARGTVAHDEEDPCDPLTNTYVLQITSEGWVRGLSGSIWEAKNGKPDMSVERFLMDAMRGVFTPARCGCSYDCCGHRHGYCDVQHLGGALFVVQVHTSRNY